ncbi:MAG: hypothetical protein PHW63_05985 [Alphaproteobacteria bacterium]|nr:hypothetical protein [Alphaproteobacteria bacterium]
MASLIEPIRRGTHYVARKMEEPTKSGGAFRLVAGAVCMVVGMRSVYLGYQGVTDLVNAYKTLFTLVTSPSDQIITTHNLIMAQTMSGTYKAAFWGAIGLACAQGLYNIWERGCLADRRRRQQQHYTP